MPTKKAIATELTGTGRSLRRKYQSQIKSPAGNKLSKKAIIEKDTPWGNIMGAVTLSL